MRDAFLKNAVQDDIISTVTGKEDKAPNPTQRRRAPWLFAGFLVAVGVVVLSFPRIVCALPWPEMTFDLADALKDLPDGLISNRTVSVTFDPSRPARGGFDVAARGRLLDWPFTGNAHVAFKGLKADGQATLSLEQTPWLASATFSGNARGEYAADLLVPETAFDENDTVLGRLVRRLAGDSVSNLAFSADLGFYASAQRTARVPVPAWNATVSVRCATAACTVGEREIKARGLRVRIPAKGIANTFSLGSIKPSLASVDIGGVHLTNATARVIQDESVWYVPEASAGFADGTLSLYALRFDPRRERAEATIMLDDISANDMLTRLTGFRGSATGRLYGKLPLVVTNGRSVRLGNAYLHTKPGESGTIRMTDAAPVLDNLSVAGVSEETRANLARALENLDYKVLKIGFKRGTELDDALLEIQIEGSSTCRGTTVPVSFSVNIHGDMEQLINTGLRAKNGNQK